MSISRLFIILLCCVQCSFLYGQEDEEWAPGTYMQQAIATTFEKASLMNALSEFSVNDKLAMGGAILNVGATISLDLELEAGKEYTFIGGGDEDVYDLDLYIVDNKGEVVASDTEDDDTPIPDFTAEYSGQYSLRLQLISGQAPTSFVSFIMMTKYGLTLEDDTFTRISENFIGSGAKIHNVSSGIKWHDLENQWCLFGLMLDEGETHQIENMRLGEASHYVYAICQENSQNIELRLQGRSGEVVAEDTETDIYPILETNTRDAERYSLNIKNVTSSGPTFILVGIVTE